MGNFKEDIARCEAFVFDVDGVMTDGGIIPTPDGDFIRRYNAKDGYALAYAIKIGYKVCIITGGRGRTLENRLRMLGIDHFYVDCMDKITAIREYMAGQGLDPANVIYMVLVLIGILVYWKAAPIAQSLAEIFGGDPAAIGRTVVYTARCEIGFCIYGPVALIGIQARNHVPKNAAGTAAGFVGLFGYLFGDAVLAKIVMGSVANDNSLGWNATFWMFIVAILLATAVCATTWKREKQALSR